MKVQSFSWLFLVAALTTTISGTLDASRTFAKENSVSESHNALLLKHTGTFLNELWNSIQGVGVIILSAGCGLDMHQCHHDAHQSQDTIIHYKIFAEGDSLTSDNILTVVEPLEEVAHAAGKNAVVVGDPSKANLLVIVGSVRFLWSEAREMGDQNATRYFERVYDSHIKDTSILGLIFEPFPTAECFASKQHAQSPIYVSVEGIPKCFRAAALKVFDLN